MQISLRLLGKRDKKNEKEANKINRANGLILFQCLEGFKTVQNL